MGLLTLRRRTILSAGTSQKCSPKPIFASDVEVSWEFRPRDLCGTHEKMILLRLESYNTESWSELLMSFRTVEGYTYHCPYHAPVVPPHWAHNLGPSHESQNKGGIRDHREKDVDKNEPLLSRWLVCSVTDLFLGELGSDYLKLFSKFHLNLDSRSRTHRIAQSHYTFQ